MPFLDNAKKRYSVRQYLSQSVESEKLDLILEAGRIAPTGANRQPYTLLVVQSKEGLEKVKQAANTYNAPLVIIVCGDHDKVWIRPYDQKSLVDIDTSIVTDHMMQQATELELGSVWVCRFKPDLLREAFNIPDHLEPINILVIGYADGEPPSPDRHDRMRRQLSEFVSYV